MNKTSAVIFEIREYTVHDGPGGRVTVFLKGCPLRCAWCHNPEGQSPLPELLVKTSRCRHCGRCIADRHNDAFQRWGRDPDACPDALISICGKEMTSSELMKELTPLREMMFLNHGGVTFSGGEPLLYTDFLEEISGALHDQGINVAVETSGFAEKEVFQRMICAVDYIMMDLKLADNEAHLRWTGQTNSGILHNAEILKRSGKPFVFRTPLIPGITDTPENLNTLGSFVGNAPWEHLPYNPMAGSKYPMVGREYPLGRLELQHEKESYSSLP